VTWCVCSVATLLGWALPNDEAVRRARPGSVVECLPRVARASPPRRKHDGPDSEPRNQSPANPRVKTDPRGQGVQCPGVAGVGACGVIRTHRAIFRPERCGSTPGHARMTAAASLAAVTMWRIQSVHVRGLRRALLEHASSPALEAAGPAPSPASPRLASPIAVGHVPALLTKVEYPRLGSLSASGVAAPGFRQWPWRRDWRSSLGAVLRCLRRAALKYVGLEKPVRSEISASVSSSRAWGRRAFRICS